MHILIVDDQESHLLLLSTLLEGIGYAAVTAQNGQEALKYLHGAVDLPDFILLDMAMPQMSGWDFLHAQEEEARLAAIPVIVMTALGPLAHKKMPPSVIAMLDKPFDLSELERLLSTHSETQLEMRAVGN